MARNEVYRDADRLSLPVPPGVKSGEPVLVGPLPGVAATDRDDVTGEATVWLDGAWDLDVTGAVAGYGLPVYITSARALTTTATGNKLFGHSLGTKGAGTGSLTVAVAQNVAVNGSGF
jgi:predicted RecA/RadA family phage recombinase